MAEQLSLNINFERQEVAFNAFNLSSGIQMSKQLRSGLDDEINVLQFYEVKGGVILRLSYRNNIAHFKVKVNQNELQKVVNAGASDWYIYRNEIIKLALSLISEELDQWTQEIRNKK